MTVQSGAFMPKIGGALMPKGDKAARVKRDYMVIRKR